MRRTDELTSRYSTEGLAQGTGCVCVCLGGGDDLLCFGEFWKASLCREHLNLIFKGGCHLEEGGRWFLGERERSGHAKAQRSW